MKEVVESNGVKATMSAVGRIQKGTPGAKKHVVSCFDRSGSGKTTAMRYAALSVGYMHLHVDVSQCSELMKGIDCCALACTHPDWGPKQKSRIVADFADILKPYVGRMLSDCLAMLKMGSFIAESRSVYERRPGDTGPILPADRIVYDDPLAAVTEIDAFLQTASERGTKVTGVVIHVDEAQCFFSGCAPRNGELKARDEDIFNRERAKAFILRAFMSSIGCSTGINKRQVIWAFTGLRLNAISQFNVPSVVIPIDVTPQFDDLSLADVKELVRSYELVGEGGTSLTESRDLEWRWNRLVGPPIISLAFLDAAYALKVMSGPDLIRKWDDIEVAIVDAMVERIMHSHITVDFETAMFCCVYPMLYNEDFGRVRMDISSVDSSLLSLAAAGLIRA